MGRAEKVAKLEALLERVQQRAALAARARVHDASESGVVAAVLAPPPSPEASAVVPRVHADESPPATRRRPTPAAPPVVRPSPRAMPVDPGNGRVVPPLSPRGSLPTPVQLDETRTPMLTPTAVRTPFASEKPLVRVSPDVTAPVSAEEVAAAAAAMTRVPTFPDPWPVDAAAANVAAAAVHSAPTAPAASEAAATDAAFPLSSPKFEVPAVASDETDLYQEDGEDPTKPLAKPPRPMLRPEAMSTDVAAPKSGDLAPPPAAGAGDRARPVTIPFDSYPRTGAEREGAPAPAFSARAMVVPREVEESPAFLTNLRPQKKGGGGVVWALLALIVLVAGGFAAYSFGLLSPYLDKEKK